MGKLKCLGIILVCCKLIGTMHEHLEDFFLVKVLFFQWYFVTLFIDADKGNPS